MKAAVCRAFGEALTIEEVELAQPGPGEVRVKLRACAICHSDLSYIDGEWGGDLPAVYGHEGAGIVEAVGEGVVRCQPGDHVVVTLIRHCKACHYCRRDAEVLCEGEFALESSVPIRDQSGAELHQAMNTGAFAEAVLVDQSQIEIVPRELAFDVASLLACGVITGYGAVARASDLKAGDHAVIVGCGGVGLNAVQAAHLSGAASVIAMDLDAAKAKTAMQFGASHAVNPTDPKAAEQVMEITGGRGADFVYVTVGAKPAIDAAQNYITKNGAIVVVGIPASGVTSVYDPGTLAAWSQKIIGTKMGNTVLSKDIPKLLRLYAQGKYKLDELISGRFRLEEINEAIDEVRQGKAVKNVIMFD